MIPDGVRALLPAGSRTRRAATGKAIWRVDAGDGRPAVLRCRRVPRWCAARDVDAHVTWIHDVLTGLQSGPVTTPRPVDLLGGSSVALVEAAVWETVTFVPGRVVGWSRSPSMTDVGALLADLHDASGRLSVERRVGPTVTVAALVDDTTWLDVDLGATADTIRRSVDVLRGGLDRIDHGRAERGVIHGDFTNHNVLATGTPRRPTGVIDFSNAYTEARLADVGFGLWRSGRASQAALAFDPSRIADHLKGYGRRRPLADGDTERVVVYLQARGLQIAAKQARGGVAVDAPLVARLEWLLERRGELSRAVAARLSTR